MFWKSKNNLKNNFISETDGLGDQNFANHV